ncbi:hypothetical protein [Roseateles amylovorans]|uniref:Uncharacterized protein n=1 Tax=Roseateles amylovorans TaxID=2978473 RepID=A0ABY6AUB6_9BURK|nr:hypothetical protein [Roseateles amylovorans]UXH76375.1 hypothetical protein N4261_15045 [Roseateles amylovorans]
MADTSLEVKTVQSLARKLDEFAEVLSPEEHAVLLGLIGTAGATLSAGHAGADTEGVDVKSVLSTPGRLPSLSVGLKDAFKSLPGWTDPAGPVSDSIGVGVACVSWSKDYNKLGPADVRGLSQIPGLRQYR